MFKKIPFIRRYSTKSNIEGWRKRDIDWKAELATVNHPHRGVITYMLRSMEFYSLWEVGMGSGANIARIVKDVGDKQLGGSDINEKAVEFCKKMFHGGIFHVESGDEMMSSDKSLDVVLTDMTLIYVGPFKIRKYLREFYRIARNYVVLVEFHESSWFKRQLGRMTGHHAHDYKKLLAKEGFYDINAQEIPEIYWPDADQPRYIITARIPQL